MTLPLPEDVTAQTALGVQHPFYLKQKKKRIPEDIKKIINSQTDRVYAPS